jgi:hypothetical protein
MADFVTKTEELKRYFPSPFYQLKPGKGLSIVLEAMGEVFDQATVDLQEYRKQFLLATATAQYLQVHGVNVDIFRPSGYNMSDNKYRELIKIVTNTSKNVEFIFERLIELFFGAGAISSGLVDCYSYRRNEIIIEIQRNALIIASNRNLYGTTYLHRTHTGAFDGFGALTWATTLAAPVSSGAMSVTLTSIVNVPTSGIIELGGGPTPEIKGFERIGPVLTFYSPVQNSYASGTSVQGPQVPDDYPSGYLYYPQQASEILGSFAAGVSSLTLNATYENLPSSGILYIGTPLSATFETKAYTRSTNTLTLEGMTMYPHSSGEPVSVPNMVRKIQTTLNQSITIGQSFSEITVVNSADFPLNSQQALRINVSNTNVEDTPFWSRKVGDNTKILIDPSYVFKQNHSPGEKVQLMAIKTTPNKDGTDWAFFLNDTDALRLQFFNILRRVKATGVKIVFSII